MPVIDFRGRVRARMVDLANLQMALQEQLHDIPMSGVVEHLRKMEATAGALSKLAGRLYDDGVQEGSKFPVRGNHEPEI